MSWLRLLTGSAVLLALVSPPSAAQHTHAAPHVPPSALDAEQTAFLQTLRDAIRRFEDQNEAIGAGFRPLGPDMPHMGQHWVHPGRAVSRDFDATAPSMLTYLDINGVATLTGAAFTIPVAAGMPPPSFPYEGAWHAHAGHLMDEAFGLVPHGVRDNDRPRLAMLHAWTEITNPDGVWAADNWALPFARRGLDVPCHVPPNAGRAVALVTGYADFFREAIHRAASPSDTDWDVIDAAFAARTQAIDTLLSTSSTTDVVALEHQWSLLWEEIENGVSASVAQALAPLFGTHAHTGTQGINTMTMGSETP